VLTERGTVVSGVGYTPVWHDVLTGSDRDGRAFPGNMNLTCNNWSSSEFGKAMLGHSDRTGLADNEFARSWNSTHRSPSFWPMRRANVSVTPPGANATIKRTDRDRVGPRPRNSRRGGKRGSTCGQMQKSSMPNFHRFLLLRSAWAGSRSHLWWVRWKMERPSSTGLSSSIRI
jgi:hypothetical protein